MLFWGLLTYLGFKKGQNALSISELNQSQIKEGQYVRGVIREIAGYYKYIVYDYVFYCSPSTMILGGEPYKIFTIKIGEEKYINIFVNEEEWELINELESYVEGKGNSAYFEGRVVKALGDELEDDWYQKALGIESKEEMDEVVISDYLIYYSIQNMKLMSTLYLCNSYKVSHSSLHIHIFFHLHCIYLSLFTFFLFIPVYQKSFYTTTKEEVEDTNYN